MLTIIRGTIRMAVNLTPSMIVVVWLSHYRLAGKN